jgi:hypothetical protein
MASVGLDPKRWYAVVDRHPDTMPPEPLPGYVWVDIGRRLMSVWREHLDVELDWR